MIKVSVIPHPSQAVDRQSSRFSTDVLYALRPSLCPCW